MRPNGEQHGRVAGAWVLGAVFLILLATLPPQPGWTAAEEPVLRSLLQRNGRWRDVAQNLALYAPLGLLLAARRVSLRRALASAAALSLLTEAIQHFVPGRDPAARDVIVNTAGAAIAFVTVRHSPLRSPAVGLLHSIELWLARSRHPPPRRASLLLLAWAACVAVIATVTAALLLPVPPPGGLFFIASPFLDRTSGPLRIGSTGSPRGFFKGTIDEIRIFNRARTAEQIRHDMLRPAVEVASRPDVVAVYGFDSNKGAVARDETGHGHDGVVSGASWTGRGRVGGALTFDGVASEVVVPRAAGLDLVEGMTLEAWLRPSGSASGESAVVFRSEGAYYLVASSTLGPWHAEVGGRFGALPRSTALTEPIPSGDWTHLAATYDAQAIRLYVNGMLSSIRVYWSPHQPVRASLNGRELSPGRVADNEAFQASLHGTIGFEGVLRCGRVDSAMAPAFLVGGLQSIDALALSASGTDLLVQPLSRAARLGLASPATRIPGALAGCAPGGRIAIELHGRLQNLRRVRAGAARTAVVPGLGSGWAFLIRTELLPIWVQLAGTAAWLAVLGVPFGVWLRPTPVAALGFGTIITALVVVPRALEVRRLDGYEISALVTGVALGVFVGRTGRRSA